jgi:hypothetical protein
MIEKQLQFASDITSQVKNAPLDTFEVGQLELMH